MTATLVSFQNISLPPKPSTAMKLTYRILFVFICALAIFSCNRNRVTIKQFEPEGEVQELQSFTFEFSDDIAPAEQIDEWVDEEYVSFEPAIQGRFKWLTSNTLLFSPDRALLPSQEYTAKVNTRSLLGGTGKNGKFETYKFHTAYFEAESVEFFWNQIPKANHRVSVQANLAFTYDVDPNELQKYLSISKAGTKLQNYTIETEQPAKVIAINFGELAQTEDAQDFQVTIRKGLNSILNRSPLAEDRTFTHTLEGITRLAIISTTSGTDGEGGWIEVRTTQTVDKDEVAKYIKLTPRPSGIQYSVAGNSIRIEGNMAAGSQVSLSIAEGLPGLYGGKLDNAYQENITLADLQPQIKFADRLGTYLVRDGMENIRIEATNVPKAKVEVYEVFKNNLLFFFYQNWSYQNLYYDRYDDYYNSTQNYYIDYYGKKLYEEKLEFQSLQNQLQAKTINLNNVLDQRFKGVYVVQVNSEENYWMRDAKLIAISDIGLIAKYSGTELMVFANSLKSAEALAGVEINLISANNQTLISGTTDEEGIARFSDLRDEVEGFEPRMITAELGDDFNFIDFRATDIETSRFDVGGKFINEDSYDCFVYSDRNLYRPGETAHLSAILRESNMSTVTEIPVAVKIITPQGKTFGEYQKTVNDQGSFELSVDLPEFAQTGQYIAEFYTGSDDLLASYRFNVEEFAPDKIRVALEKSREEISPGQQIAIDINAEYLFGAPAANHKYEMDISLGHRSYTSKNFSDFDFSNYSTENSYIENTFSEGNLDANGKAIGRFTLPNNINSGGYVEGRAFVSVFDVTGRTVNRMATFKAFPKDYFIGTKGQGYYFGVNRNITFDLIAVDPQDKAINNFDAEVELIRYEWATVLERNTYSGRYSYRSVEKEIPEGKKSIKLSGVTPYSFQVSRSGRYELRISKRGSSDYIKKRFYAYSWGSATASSFEINKEGQIDIILDKESYAPGETAKALFVTPFRGKMLVTLEQNKVIEHRYLEVTANSTEIPIPLSEAHVPNVYISATLFRPHKGDDNIPFLVGHGYASISVSNPDNQLDVEIIAPEKIKPRRTEKITIKTDREQDIFVTLAAVDEGVLQVKNFKSPDPHAHMYAKRGLGVQSYDLYEYLLPEIVSSSPAGGDEFGGGARLNPVKAKRFKLLAQWSGIKRTNSRGEVTIPIEIPQYNGEVRLMAVAYKGKRFGSASKPMKVADDVILMPSIPRFLSTNDSLTVPVSVMNTSDKSGEVTVHMTVEGPISVEGGKFESLNLAANQSGTANFVIRTSGDIGSGKITFASSGLDKVVEEIEIGVRPVSPLVTESQGGSIAAGSSQSIQIPANFIESTQKTSINLSTFPALEHGEHLKYLIGYPHGCLEQTISKLFPQLYFQELALMVAPEAFTGGNPAYYVKEGVHKLESMSRYDGSFAYWQGGTEMNWWGSVYATHFLLEARSAGYVVNDDILERALSFLSKKASEKSIYDYVNYTGGSRRVTKIANKEIIYSLYVLALAGKSDISLMNYYRGRPNLLANDTKYLLAGAFALAKDYNAYNDIIPAGFENEQAARTTGGSFDSEARANAIMLNVLLDVDPSNRNIPQMINHLVGMAEDKIWSTQDRAWTFLALGKAASQQANSDVRVDVEIDGRTVTTLSKSNPSFDLSSYSGKRANLNATGKGKAFYLWQSSGIKSNGSVQEVDENMQIRRTYFDRSGNEITDLNFAQGDLIVCRISLVGGERSAENIAITDMIPAGFEIENPRLTPSANLNWIEQVQNRFEPDHLDVRDDRLVLFTDLERQKTKNFHYLLRAVNTGTFQLPAIGADAMYDPSYRSYHGGGVVRVR